MSRMDFLPKVTRARAMELMWNIQGARRLHLAGILTYEMYEPVIEDRWAEMDKLNLDEETIDDVFNKVIEDAR